jgi:oligo-1,6-glucosidase
MVKLRKENDVLVYGDYELLELNILIFMLITEHLNNEKVLVLLNFTDHDSSIELQEIGAINEVMINNYSTVKISNNKASNLNPIRPFYLS